MGLLSQTNLWLALLTVISAVFGYMIGADVAKW